MKRIFRSEGDKALRRYAKRAKKAGLLEEGLMKLSSDELSGRAKELRALVERRGTNETLEEVFALVREAGRRALGQRLYDVQLMGGMALHEGNIAEMKTGEGKTLAATAPAFLNALTGGGVHIVTVNDYLARRDAEWMGQVYGLLGLTTGCVGTGASDEERREAYAADVTYGTNNELGFDYLRDNMKYGLADMVQRGHAFAIVDEVDSILVDEARTPLIISGPSRERVKLYVEIDALVERLSQGSYEVDEKFRTVILTEEGMEEAETLLREEGLLADESGLYAVRNTSLVHHVNQALRARRLFTRDKDYIVRDGSVVIVDEFTGRATPGRRYGDGLHQALEAKEGLSVQEENVTLASITFQNYFRLYEKLSGMTGTAATESEEFSHIYGLEVVEVPPNRPFVRDDQHDEVYRTQEEKMAAIVETVKELHEAGQPILAGTGSIEKSEALSTALEGAKIPHEVLNARRHEREAKIVAQAGRLGAITIATNMAGRGTDIQLGGNADMRVVEETAGLEGEEKERKEAEIREETEKEKGKVVQAGGLFVLGAERHENRRIDNQLRGRSGRQGDPGASRFFLSLEDDLLRIFGSQRLDGMLRALGLREGEAIVHPLINRAIMKAQKRVEAQHFDVRKNLLRYDDVINDQRKAVFARRLELMGGEDVAETAKEMRESAVESIVSAHAPEKAYAEQWDMSGMATALQESLRMDLPVDEWAKEEGTGPEELRARTSQACEEKMEEKRLTFGDDAMRQVEKAVLLHTLDALWREHLQMTDQLRHVIGLRGYGQRDPLNEYRAEAFHLFEDMLERFNIDATGALLGLETRPPPVEETPPPEMSATPPSPGSGAMLLDGLAAKPDLVSAPLNAAAPINVAGAINADDPLTWGRTPRNARCPCGSGLKYKRCHGRLD